MVVASQVEQSIVAVALWLVIKAAITSAWIYAGPQGVFDWRGQKES
jgi:hypothetical protein